LHRFGKGITLQVKIGTPEDFIGSIQESVLTREATVHRTGSVYGRPQSPPQSPPAPVNAVVETATTNDGLAVQNFTNFIENSFEHAVLIEQHLVSSTDNIRNHL